MLSFPWIFRLVIAPSMDCTWQVELQQLLLEVELEVELEELEFWALMLVGDNSEEAEDGAFSMLILAKTIMDPMVLHSM